MNENLKKIQDLFQKRTDLTKQDKEALIKAIVDADKQWAITEFKLERTEKVKRTTAILLEETIEELEQKRKTVEAQNHELEIESSLERVRTVAMSMNRPDDMLHVCQTIGEQLELLKVKEIRNVQTAIFYQEKGTYMNYEYYAKHDKTFITETNYTGHEIHQDFANKMLKGNGEFMIAHIKGDEVKDWLAYQKTTNVFIDDYLKTASSLNYYWFSLGPVALGISTYSPLSEDEINLFKRFLKVFELSYRRYLDIEKAEAQAHEARIETALERVRSRSLAMHKSDELSVIAKTMFEQLQNLGLELEDGLIIMLFREGSRDQLQWPVFQGINIEMMFLVPYFDHPILNEVYKARETGVKFIERHFDKTVKDDFLEKIFSITDYKVVPVDFQNKNFSGSCYHYSFAMETYTGILLQSYNRNKYPEEHNDILRRFARVFEQAYVRFLDLQKAEAQAREAQIELALERVRARTMAMQNSDELPEAANLLFQQMQALGMPAWSAGYCIWDENKQGITLWMSSEGVMQPSFHAPLTEDPSFIHFREAYERGESFHVEAVGGDELISHYKYMRTLPGIGEILDSIINAGHSLPTFQIFHCAYFSQGFLLFIAYEPVIEAHDIFKRFAKVFEQTYTRFLDLQKSEAQARESQIEAALERVRSRSMAMHKSDELLEAAEILFVEMNKLGIESLTAGFVLMDKEEKNGLNYTPDPSTKKIMPLPIIIPHNESIHLQHVVENWKKGSSFYIVAMDEEETVKHQTFIAERSTNFPLNAKQLIAISPAKLLLHNFYFKEGYLLIVGGKKLSVEQTDIMLRFTRVFQQTFTRFLDLQKSEAQAREAQIELALERVRSRTMAMQKSEELAEAAQLLYHEFGTLGINTFTCGYMFIDEAQSVQKAWATLPDGTLLADYINFPLTGDPILDNRYKSWKKKEPIHVADVEGEINKEHHRFLSKHVPENIAKDIFSHIPDRIIFYSANFSNGYLFILATELFSAQEEQTIVRFAKVFEMTYTRFLDLKHAEATAREAQIQLALERARTQSMIMQHSNELDDTLRVFHEQVLLLGIKSAFSFLWLPDEEKDRHIFWAAWAENNSTVFNSKAINYPLDRKEPATKQCLIDWKSNDHVVAYHVPPDGVANYFAAWSELIAGVEQLKAEYFSDGLYYVEAFMKYGCFGVIVKNTLFGDEKKILERFAIEFERAYTRFLDLQKAEAQTREAQIEAALERVRSRSMAMHKSEELKEVIRLVLEQFIHLKVNAEHAGFYIDYKAHDDMHIWLADPNIEPFFAIIPYFDSPTWNSFLEAKSNGTAFHADVLDFEEKNKFYKSLFKLFAIPEEAKEFYLQCKGLAVSTVLLDNVGLYIENFSGIPYSDEENKILMRFGKVFQQTYTRVLDLQKAEAQAREAQIELSLERVRAKTMAMHNSQHVADTVAAMFDELVKLGVDKTTRSGVAIIGDKDDMEIWTASSHANGEIGLDIGRVDLNIHPLIKGFRDTWGSKKSDYVYELIGGDLKDYFKAINDSPDYPTQFDLASLPSKQIHSSFFFAEGAIYAFSPEPLTAEVSKIFKRFAGVFGQMYRRYLDLQKAETQAR